jgi:hypothetical protein
VLQVEVGPGVALGEAPGGLVVAGFHEEGVEVQLATTLGGHELSSFPSISSRVRGLAQPSFELS